MTVDTETVAAILAIIESGYWDSATKLEMIHEMISDNFRPETI